MSKPIKARSTNNPNKHNAVYVTFHLNGSNFFADTVDVHTKKGEYIYFTGGDASKLLGMNNTDICECLKNLSFSVGKDKVHIHPEFVVSYDNIGFNCYKRKPFYNRVSKCLAQMYAGHCPYAFAKMLFPNSYKEK